MTKEESIAMWSLEKLHVKEDSLTKGMKKLYKKVDELITNGSLGYDTFGNDMLEMVTTMIVDTTKDGKELDRAEQIDFICDKLLKIYEDKYNDKEPVVGDSELSEDSVAIQDESGVREPESTTETC